MVVATVGLLLVLLDWSWKPKLDLPYPSRIPLMGHLLSFIKCPHVMLTSWAQTCGDIYCLQLLNKTLVIVSGYEAAHEVLLTRGKDFGDRLRTFRNDLLSGNGNDIIFQSINPKWKELRLLVHHNVKQFGEGLGRIEESVNQTAQQLIEAIDRDSANGVLDPHDNVYFAIAHNIMSLLSGTQVTLSDPIFKKIIEVEQLMMKSITVSKGAELDLMPWLRHFGNKTFQDLSTAAKGQTEIYNTFKKMYKTKSLAIQGLVFSLIDNMENPKGEASDILNDNVNKVVLADVLTAALSTSAASLHVFLLLMASHPQIQQKLFQEISICKGTNPGEISLADRSNMPYARACLFEVLRYAGIAPLTIDHTAAVDTEISGHKIPKGTAVYVNLFGLHHSEKYWDEPWTFKPERFLDDEGQLLASDHIQRKRLMPFGAGPRVCIGQSFALARLFILTTSLVQEFKISPVPGETIEIDPRKYELRAILNAPRAKLFFKTRVN